MKPGIKVKILSESEVGGKKSSNEINNLENTNSQFQFDADKLNQISKIRSLRGNNPLLHKIKKQMDLRKNFEEIYREVERKSLEYEKKLLENKLLISKSSSDKKVYTKSFFYKEKSPEENLKLTSDVYYCEEENYKDEKMKLPKISK